MRCSFTDKVNTNIEYFRVHNVVHYNAELSVFLSISELLFARTRGKYRQPGNFFSERKSQSCARNVFLVSQRVLLSRYEFLKRICPIEIFERSKYVVSIHVPGV